jgi:hypothetical protein
MDEGRSDVRSVNGKPSRNADKCQIYKVVCMPTWMSYRKQEGEKIGQYYDRYRKKGFDTSIFSAWSGMKYLYLVQGLR